MYYATQRIENILGMIASTQKERDSKKELLAWIALTAETQRCQELIEFADHLLRVKEIGASTQQSIKEFCRFAPSGFIAALSCLFTSRCIYSSHESSGTDERYPSVSTPRLEVEIEVE